MRFDVPLVFHASLLGAVHAAWLPQFNHESPHLPDGNQGWSNVNNHGPHPGEGQYPDHHPHGAPSNSWGKRPQIPPHYKPGETVTSLSSTPPPSFYSSSSSSASSSSSSSYLEGTSSATTGPAYYPTSPSSSSIYPTSVASASAPGYPSNSANSTYAYAPSSTLVQSSTDSIPTTYGPGSSPSSPQGETITTTYTSGILTTITIYPTSASSLSSGPAASSSETEAYPPSLSTSLIVVTETETSYFTAPTSYSAPSEASPSSSAISSPASPPPSYSVSESTIVITTTVSGTLTTYITTTQVTSSDAVVPTQYGSGSVSSSSSTSSDVDSTTASTTSTDDISSSSSAAVVPYPTGNTTYTTYPSVGSTGSVIVSSSSATSPSSSSATYSANSTTVYVPTGSGSPSSYSIVSSSDIYRNGSCFTSTANSSLTTSSSTGSIPSASASVSLNSTTSSILTTGFTSSSTASITPSLSANSTTSSSVASLTPSVSANSTTSSSSVVSSSSATTSSSTLASLTPSASANSTVTSSSSLTTSSSTVASLTPSVSANSTSSLTSSTSSSISSTSTTSSASSSTAATSTSSSPTSSTMAPTISPTTSCSNLCSSFSANGFDAHLFSCTSVSSGSTITVPSGQSGICGSSETAPVDLCRVTLSVITSDASETYIEVWMPSNNDWNGRVMATDNGGLNGCVAYDQLSYIIGKGFAVVGDNGGHNTSAFDGTWMAGNNERILDWSHRARHASINTGKQLINKYYGQDANKAYYIGCSTGGQQGMKSAQTYPNDFDGIIAGSAAIDYNHLQDWSGRFLLLTGTSGSDSFLTQDEWLTVQNEVLRQCDEPLDGVNDGVIEDPSLCIPVFNATKLLALGLTQTQVTTVEKVHTELYDQEGNLLFPAFQYGAEYDGYRTGLLKGTPQGITHDWFYYGVYNGSGFDPESLSQTDYTAADDQDALHDYVSAYNPDLSAFENAGGKILQYHGLADPMITGFNAQRYYLKVAEQLGASNTDLDSFYRLFRISGMAHCSVGGVSGAGAWQFGQDEVAAQASANVIDIMVDWVENGNAPDTLQGTKFWYDTPSYGVQFKRNHCRFPYRTTYNGGDSTDPNSWSCKLISDWQECGPGATPRLC